MILVIRSDLFYSIGASHVTKIITPSDPMRETDHLDHDSSDRESNKPIEASNLSNIVRKTREICDLISSHEY